MNLRQRIANRHVKHIFFVVKCYAKEEGMTWISVKNVTNKEEKKVEHETNNR